jgi:hypothetical protein
MSQRPLFQFLLFLASMIITGSILLGISGCAPEKKQPEPPKEAKTVHIPPVPAHLPLSVDFDNVALSAVAQFVTAQTGKGFVLSGNEAKPITWIESNLSKETLFESFKATVTASGLTLEAANETGTLFTIRTPEERKVPYQLNFAMSPRGTFFLLGQTVYPLEKFPYPARYDAGHWYALLPQSIADQFDKGQATID